MKTLREKQGTEMKTLREKQETEMKKLIDSILWNVRVEDETPSGYKIEKIKGTVFSENLLVNEKTRKPYLIIRKKST